MCSKAKLKHYIFLTAEGSTFQPNSNFIEPDIENMQVIGFACGKTADKAFENLVEDKGYLVESNFDKVFSLTLEDDKKRFFSLNRRRGG